MNNLSDEKIYQIYCKHSTYDLEIGWFLSMENFKKAVSEILEEIESDTCKWELIYRKTSDLYGIKVKRGAYKTCLTTHINMCDYKYCPYCGKTIEVVNE